MKRKQIQIIITFTLKAAEPVSVFRSYKNKAEMLDEIDAIRQAIGKEEAGIWTFNATSIIMSEVEAVSYRDVTPKYLKPILFITFCSLCCLAFVASSIFFTERELDKMETEYNTEHAVGVFECPNCGSTETKGFYTFSPLVGGSREYQLDNAVSSLFSCDYCGHYWNVFRAEWEAKGY